MKKRLMLQIALLLTLAVQLAVPASLVINREITLRFGAPYKFQVRPIDPYDVFRGRYVYLSIKDVQKTLPKGIKLPEDVPLYATLGTDANGFGIIAQLSNTPPRKGNYLNASVDLDAETATLQIPHDRYYLEEKFAPEAEAAYAHYSRQENLAYITLRVRGGESVLENVYVDGKTIVQFAKEALEAEKKQPKP